MKNHKSLYLVMVILTGCSSGSGEGLNSNGLPLQDGDDAPLSTEFKSIQSNVFTPLCTVCHAGASAPVGLKLDEANSYSMLVGVESNQAPGTLRVDPGNPDASYIIAKLEGSAAVGGQMPLGGPSLPQSSIDLIRQWISDGAPPPTTTPPPLAQPPTVTSTTPANGETLRALPQNINAVFSHDINASTVVVDTVILQRSGEDGTFGDGNEVMIVPASMGLSNVNTTLVTMDLTAVTSVDDTYQLTLMGNGAAPLQDLNGNALDGNNDGAAGGDFNAIFTVASSNPAQQATWRSIQDNVFTPICIACHINNSAPENLKLDETNSYAMLVNVPSAQQPSLLRVAPGDPDNSYLIHKLEGVAASGSQMPQGGPALPQVTIDMIRQWISDGAPADGTSPGEPPPDGTLALTLTAPVSVVNGDEFPLSLTVQNMGSATVSGASLNQSWSPADNIILRDGEASQSLPALNASASTVVNWVMRGKVSGEVTVTITTRESNGAITKTAASITITE